MCDSDLYQEKPMYFQYTILFGMNLFNLSAGSKLIGMHILSLLYP